MESVLSWGLEVVRVAQAIKSPAVTVLMKIVTFLGSEIFFLAAFPLIYWCVDRRRGARLGLVFLGAAFVNLWVKDFFLQPRPYDLDPTLGLAREKTPGFPSGHSQHSALFWGLAAPHIRKPWGMILAFGLPLLIGFSRVYLGVHFPTDVFGGWAIALLVLLLDATLFDRLERALERMNVRIKVALVAAVAFAMNALNMHDTSMGGVFFGAGIGFAFVGSLAPFSAEGRLGARIGRYLLGLGGAILLYALPKLLLPGEGSALYPLLRFLRYGLLGAWASLGAPLVFLHLGLAEREKD